MCSDTAARMTPQQVHDAPVRRPFQVDARATIAVSVAATVLLYVSRCRDAFDYPQLVAEDGRVFFMGAKLRGWASVTDTYAGYLHLIPRLIAMSAQILPAASAPAAYLLATTAVMAWTAATIASSTFRHAWILAPLAMAVPGCDEIFGTLTNIHWFTQAGLLIVVLSGVPAGRLARVNQLVFASAVALTGPFSIFAAPLAVWRLATDLRTPPRWSISAVVATAGLVQFRSATRAMDLYRGVRSPAHLAVTMLDRWLGQMAHLGLSTRPVFVRDDVALLIVVAICLCANLRIVWPLYAYAAIAMAATFVRFVPDSGFFDFTGSGERYFDMPRLVVLWSLALGLLRLRPSALAAGIGLAMVGASFETWEVAPLPHLPWRSEAWKIDEGRAVRIVINPSPIDEDTAETWVVRLPDMP